MSNRTREQAAAAAARVIADGPVPLRTLAKSVPSDREGRRGVNASTLARWIVHGRRGIHLDGARLAGRGWCSSEAAIRRFAEALSGAAVADSAGTPAAPTERERRVQAAREELERLRRGG